MEYLYYPGCTLIDTARNFDRCGRAAARALDVELVEMPDWTCCGTTFPLTNRKIVGLVAPVRTLVNTKRAGYEELLTLCSFCYNVLKRANYAVRNRGDERMRINAYLEDEFAREGQEYSEYEGQVEVVHLLEVLRDKVGFESVTAQVTRPLEDLKVAPYYGCLLLRPQSEIGLDDADEPTVLEDLLGALGCDAIDFPHRVECCGSYLGLSSPDIALQNSYEVVHTASRLGADVLAVVCPLCAYNLDLRQEEMHQRFSGFRQVPVMYFTELLALALEVDEEAYAWDRHAVDPLPVLQAVGGG
jgi:heterodisulfide reductase subunit B